MTDSLQVIRVLRLSHYSQSQAPQPEILPRKVIMQHLTTLYHQAHPFQLTTKPWRIPLHRYQATKELEMMRMMTLRLQAPRSKTQVPRRRRHQQEINRFNLALRWLDRHQNQYLARFKKSDLFQEKSPVSIKQELRCRQQYLKGQDLVPPKNAHPQVPNLYSVHILP